MNRYHLVHTTEFLYDGPVRKAITKFACGRFMTKSRAAFRSACLPHPGSRGTSYRDAFGNWVHQFNILPEHQPPENRSGIRGAGA